MHRYLHSVEDLFDVDDEYVLRASSDLGDGPKSRRPHDYSDDGDDDDDFDDYDDGSDDELDSDDDAEYDYDDRDDDRY